MSGVSQCFLSSHFSFLLIFFLFIFFPLFFSKSMLDFSYSIHSVICLYEGTGLKIKNPTNYLYSSAASFVVFLFESAERREDADGSSAITETGQNVPARLRTKGGFARQKWCRMAERLNYTHFRSVVPWYMVCEERFKREGSIRKQNR